MSLTTGELDRILDYARQASPAPVAVMQVPDDYDPVQWFADACLHTVGETVYGVAMGSPEVVEAGGALMTCLTGNGLASLANANFYALCHTAVPLLVAEIHRLRRLAEEPTPPARRRKQRHRPTEGCGGVAMPDVAASTPPGQLAYAAYVAALRPSVVRYLPALYANLRPEERLAWEAAAQAVLDAFLSSAQRLASPPAQEEPHGA